MTRRALPSLLALVAVLACAPVARANHVTHQMLSTAAPCTGYVRTGGRILVVYGAPVPDVDHDTQVSGTLRVGSSSVTNTATLGADHVAWFRQAVPRDFTYAWEITAHGKQVAGGTIRVAPGTTEPGCTEASIAAQVEHDRRAFERSIRAGSGGATSTGREFHAPEATAPDGHHQGLPSNAQAAALHLSVTAHAARAEVDWPADASSRHHDDHDGSLAALFTLGLAGGAAGVVLGLWWERRRHRGASRGQHTQHPNP